MFVSSQFTQRSLFWLLLAQRGAAQALAPFLFIYLSFSLRPPFIYIKVVLVSLQRGSAAPHTSLHPSIPPELRQQPFILTIATSKFTLVTYC